MGREHLISTFFRGWAIVAIGVAACLHSAAAEQLKPETIAAFDRYTRLSEQRMTEDLQSGLFLYLDGLSSKEKDAAEGRLKKGEVLTERLGTLERGQSVPVPVGLIHHWRGIVFIPSVTLAQTLAFLQDYDNEYKFYAPDVQVSKLLEKNGNDFKIFLRLRKHEVMTVILNTNYDVKYTLRGSDRATSYSYSTRIAEVENVGKSNEFDKTEGNNSGFLWRLNSYWRFLERDGGTYVQLEAISLTRDIPAALQWLISPFVTGIPKESLVFTLTRTRKALHPAASEKKN
jgi:hypothetical protein